MPFFDRVRATQVLSPTAADTTNDIKDGGVQTQTSMSDQDSDVVSKDAQVGVQKMEATTQAWSRSHLIAAYVL